MRSRIHRKEALDAKTHYDLDATRYASWDHNIPNLPATRIRELSSSHSFSHILDVGCGTGRYFQYVYGTQQFVGLDISGKMLDIAQQKRDLLYSNGFKAVDFIESDIYRIQNDQLHTKFDFIYSIGVLGYHIPFNYEVASIIFDLLQTGGFFLMQTVQEKPIRKLRKTIARILVAYNLKSGSLLSSYSTSAYSIKRVANRAGLTILNLEKEPNKHSGLPMLITLFQK